MVRAPSFPSALQRAQIPSLHSVQSVSRVPLFASQWTAACPASLSVTNSQSLLELMSLKSVMPSNHLILCRPLLLPSIFPSIRGFSNESVLRIRWPKYWSFGFRVSPSNEYLRLISFRIDWLDLAVQGTLKSLLQHHSSEASILPRSAFSIPSLGREIRSCKSQGSQKGEGGVVPFSLSKSHTKNK